MKFKVKQDQKSFQPVYKQITMHILPVFSVNLFNGQQVL